MDFIKQIERIIKAHDLICSEQTGKPEVFAEKLGISLSQLNHDLEFFKVLHADVRYSVKKKTFYYAKSANLDFLVI